MGKEFVVYNGLEVVSYWPESVERAQRFTHYQIGGKAVQRVRYGDESGDWGAKNHPCGDCAVLVGQYHVPGCDVEQCPVCHGQPFVCGCDYEEDEEELLSEYYEEETE